MQNVLNGLSMVVGAPLEDSSAKGISSDQPDNAAPEAGAIHI